MIEYGGRELEKIVAFTLCRERTEHQKMRGNSSRNGRLRTAPI